MPDAVRHQCSVAIFLQRWGRSSFDQLHRSLFFIGSNLGDSKPARHFVPPNCRPWVAGHGQLRLFIIQSRYRPLTQRRNKLPTQVLQSAERVEPKRPSRAALGSKTRVFVSAQRERFVESNISWLLVKPTLVSTTPCHHGAVCAFE